MYRDYIKLGWSVFPVAGPTYADDPAVYKTWKVPLVYWQEFQKRLPTEKEISLWERKWPKAWVGGTTGPLSGFMAIDIDGEKGLASLKSLNSSMPVTRTSKTLRGYHYCFKWSPRMNAYATNTVGILPGIDLRGDGSFIILPSGNPERVWACEEGLAEMPELWYSIMEKSEMKRDAANWRSQAITELSDGNRHDTFVRLAASAMNIWPLEDALAVLLPTARSAGFENEAKEIIVDVYNRYKYKGGTMEDRRKEVRRWTDQLDQRVKDYFPNGIPPEWKERCPAVISEFERLLGNFEKLCVEWETEKTAWKDSLAQGAYEQLITYLNELHAMPRRRRESDRQGRAFEQWATHEKNNVRVVTRTLKDDNGDLHPDVAKVISILGGRVRETLA